MCGLIYLSRYDHESAARSVSKRYHKQKNRGKSGFGYIGLSRDGKINGVHRSTEEKPILDEMKEDRSPTIFFHHRMPTSTPNIVESTHPILVSNVKLAYDYYVIHNGVISNVQEMVDKHIDMGFQYTTAVEKILRSVKTGKTYEGHSRYQIAYGYDTVEVNDSECLAIELALAIDRGLDKVEVVGSAAFLVLQVDKITQRALKLYYGTNTNPLKIHNNGRFCMISSEGGGEDVPKDRLYCYVYATNQSSHKKLDIPLYKATPKVSFYGGEHSGSYSDEEFYGWERHKRAQLDKKDDAGDSIYDINAYYALIEEKEELEVELKRNIREGNEEEIKINKDLIAMTIGQIKDYDNHYNDIDSRFHSG